MHYAYTMYTVYAAMLIVCAWRANIQQLFKQKTVLRQ